MAEEKMCSKEGCTGDCSSCGSAHGASPEITKEPQNAQSNIKKVIGVVSGKGGVGKSLVTASLAVALRRAGNSVAVLDADITGPSIPKMFGIKNRAMASDAGIFPAESDSGIKIMSINLLLETEESPVVWRGPVIAGAVKQFWTDVLWGDVDYMFVDMPPGTGDVPLTVFQSLPIDGIVIVASPQELVSMIVKKAYNMAEMMNIPVLGIIENMSFLECPDCGKKLYPFGKGKTESAAKELGVDFLGAVPIDPSLAALSDAGEFDHLNPTYVAKAAEKIEKL